MCRYSDNECLGEQVRVYEDRQIGDQHEMVMPGGVDITNHEHLFRAVFEKVSTDINGTQGPVYYVWYT